MNAPTQQTARFSLTLLLASTLVAWILAGPSDTSIKGFGSVLLAGCTLGSAVWAARGSLRAGLIAGAAVEVCAIAAFLLERIGASGAAIQLVLLLVVAMGTPVILVRALLRHGRVDLQLLLGAITIYLFVAISFTAAYAITAKVQNAPLLMGASGPTDATFADQLYFSFVTMTTTGYGDLTPLSGTARALALLEAMTGQLYLVIAVAAIVSALAAQPRSSASAQITSEAQHRS